MVGDCQIGQLLLIFILKWGNNMEKLHVVFQNYIQ